jgi:hypothetical protein
MEGQCCCRSRLLEAGKAGSASRKGLSFVNLLCAMAGELAIYPEAGHERTGAHITNLSHGSGQLDAFGAERCKISGFGHASTWQQ